MYKWENSVNDWLLYLNNISRIEALCQNKERILSCTLAKINKVLLIRKIPFSFNQ